LVTSCTRTTLYNILLIERQKAWEDEEEDMSSYYMTLRKCEDHSVWRTCFGRGKGKTDYVMKMMTSFSSKQYDLNYYHYTIV